MKKYTERNSITYLDYYSSMVTSNKGLKKEYTYDGVHPNRSGYKLMSSLADKAISETLDLIGKSE